VEPGTRLRTVEHNHLIASIQQVLRHARTHVAKANYANGGASDRVLGEGTCINHALRCHSLSVRYKWHDKHHTGRCEGACSGTAAPGGGSSGIGEGRAHAGKQAERSHSNGGR